MNATADILPRPSATECSSVAECRSRKRRPCVRSAAPVAQLVEVAALEAEGCQFKSDPGHHASLASPAEARPSKRPKVSVRIRGEAPNKSIILIPPHLLSISAAISTLHRTRNCAPRNPSIFFPARAGCKPSAEAAVSPPLLRQTLTIIGTEALSIWSKPMDTQATRDRPFCTVAYSRS